MDRRTIIALLKKYLHLLNSEGISIERAFLYGSYAKNNASDNSDIDVLLVSDTFKEKNDKIIGKTWRLSSEIDARIEPFIIDTEKFSDTDFSPLAEIVKKEGIEISF